MKHIDEQFENIVVLSTCQLFEAEGFALKHKGSTGQLTFPAGTRAVAGLLGFAGTEMRGTVVLASPLSFAELAHPAANENAGPSEASLRDWAGEATNMLLGRIKNQLLRHTVEIYMATPNTVCGDNICIPSLREHPTDWQVFEGNGEVLHVRFDVCTQPNFVLPEEQESRDGDGAEGDVMLF